MKKILIDARFVGIGESISLYTLEIVSRIALEDTVNEYTLLIRPQGESEIEKYPAIINAKNFKIDVLDIPHYSWAEQTKLLKYLNKNKFDLVHFTQFNHPLMYRGDFVVTVHDVTLFGHLHHFSKLKGWAFGKTMKSAMFNSKKIITVSETSKKEILDYYDVSEKKIAVTYLGIDHEKYNLKVKKQQSEIGSFKKNHEIIGDYILYAGMWKKHKNLLRTLKAFEKFKSENNLDIQLVLAGKIDKNEPEIIAEIQRIDKSFDSKFSTQHSIITTGFIPGGELPIAYAGALLYIIPSLSEGFGLPPLEAMACGTAVIASKESCIPEILGSAPLYFDPYDIEDITLKIVQASTDEVLRNQLSKRGLEQSQKYNWSITAKETLGVFKEILNSKK